MGGGVLMQVNWWLVEFETRQNRTSNLGPAVDDGGLGDTASTGTTWSADPTIGSCETLQHIYCVEQ